MNSPDLYNIALDCIDKHAHSLHNKHKIALIFVDDSVGAVREPPLRLTFANLEGLTNRFANALLQLDRKPGERLLIRLPNRPEFPVTFLGAIKAGLIPIPNSPFNTWHELKYLLEDSGSSVLVTTGEFLCQDLLENPPLPLKHVLVVTGPRSQRPEAGSQTLEAGRQIHDFSGFRPPASGFSLNRWEDLLKNASPFFNTEPTPADSPAFWLYTSGTEGNPKAVIHAHRSIRAHDSRARLWQDLKANDVIFNTSALNWSYALTCGMLDVWRHGLPTLIYSGELNAGKICHLVKHFGVTTFMSVPGIYRRLVEHALSTPSPFGERAGVRGEMEDAFNQVRVCLSAGEKLPEEIRDRFRKATGLEIYEGLGMTEHSVYLFQSYGSPLVPGSCGKPAPDSHVAILREDLSEAACEEIGILASHRSSLGLMLGYHTNVPTPQASKGNQGYVGDWFLSGDLATRDEEGNFFFQGRRDDMITSGGYRISPLEVESVLNQHPLVSESAAVSQEWDVGKTLLVAYVVLQHPKKRNEEEVKVQLMNHAEKHLAKYKLPREILFVEQLPKTTNGKIKRGVLAGAKP